MVMNFRRTKKEEARIQRDKAKAMGEMGGGDKGPSQRHEGVVRNL